MGQRPFSGKYAVEFHGPGSGDMVVLPHQERFDFTGPFSVAVWFKVDRFTTYYQAIVFKGPVAWRLQQEMNGNNLSFTTNHGPVMPQDSDQAIGRTSVADGRWHLAVGMYEPAGKAAILRYYLDGHLEAEGIAPPVLQRGDGPVLLGTNILKPPPCREFCGWIDEVAIFARAMPAAEVAAMFQAGNPAECLHENQTQGGSGPDGYGTFPFATCTVYFESFTTFFFLKG